MTSKELAEELNAIEASHDDVRHDTRYITAALLEIAYQLAIRNEREASDEEGVRRILNKVGLPDPQPGKRDADSERGGYWLIYFEDASMRPEVFGSERTARLNFENRRENWNCHLFREVQPAETGLAESSTAPATSTNPSEFGEPVWICSRCFRNNVPDRQKCITCGTERPKPSETGLAESSTATEASSQKGLSPIWTEAYEAARDFCNFYQSIHLTDPRFDRLNAAVNRITEILLS